MVLSPSLPAASGVCGRSLHSLGCGARRGGRGETGRCPLDRTAVLQQQQGHQENIRGFTKCPKTL